MPGVADFLRPGKIGDIAPGSDGRVIVSALTVADPGFGQPVKVAICGLVIGFGFTVPDLASVGVGHKTDVFFTAAVKITVIFFQRAGQHPAVIRTGGRGFVADQMAFVDGLGRGARVVKDQRRFGSGGILKGNVRAAPVLKMPGDALAVLAGALRLVGFDGVIGGRPSLCIDIISLSEKDALKF